MYLDRTRQPCQYGLAAISIGDIKAYLDLTGITNTEDILKYIEILTHIDLKYRQAYGERLEQELESNRKKRK